MPREEECPVCFCQLYGDVGVSSTQNSLACSAGHRVCTECMRKLIEPREKGWCFRCPLCRRRAALTPYHVAVLLKGTWDKAREAFEDDEHVMEWLESRVAVPSA